MGGIAVTFGDGVRMLSDIGTAVGRDIAAPDRPAPDRSVRRGSADLTTALVALLPAVHVGGATIAMADFRGIGVDAGFDAVRTLHSAGPRSRP